MTQPTHWTPRLHRFFNPTRVVKIARNLAVVLVLLLVAFLVLEPLRGSSIRAKAIRAKAATIQVGDDTNRVRSVLGEPTESITVTGSLQQMFFLNGAAERWSYASSLNFFPVIHWTDTNDLAVYFDSAGRVMRVQIPKDKSQPANRRQKETKS